MTAPAGAVEGTSEGAMRVFKGIPYARRRSAPDAGGRPWPMPPWTGVRQATEFGPACMQPIWAWQEHLRANIAPISEDCLTLNVWAPADAKQARRCSSGSTAAR